jgi:hypothetical protein
MSFGSYSTTPASNTSINGINIAPNCAAGNVDNAIRQIMADGRELYDIVDAIDVSGFVSTSGGYVGALYLTGAGGYRYNAQSSLTHGAMFFYPLGTARPTGGEGMVVFYY